MCCVLSGVPSHCLPPTLGSALPPACSIPGGWDGDPRDGDAGGSSSCSPSSPCPRPQPLPDCGTPVRGCVWRFERPRLRQIKGCGVTEWGCGGGARSPAEPASPPPPPPPRPPSLGVVGNGDPHSSRHGLGPRGGAGVCRSVAGLSAGTKTPLTGTRRPLRAGPHSWGPLVKIFLGGSEPGGWSRDAKGPPPSPACSPGAQGRGGERGGFGVHPAAGRDGCARGLALDGGRDGAAPPCPPQPHKSPFVRLPPRRPGKAPTWLRCAELIFNISLASESKFPPLPGDVGSPQTKAPFFPPARQRGGPRDPCPAPMGAQGWWGAGG